MNTFKYIPSASIYANNDFFCIDTESGYIGKRPDPDVPSVFCAPNVSNVELGNIILSALSKSRCIPRDEAIAFGNFTDVVQKYKIWVEETMAAYGYKTKAAMFKKMEHCSISLIDGTIKILPLKHVKLEAWEGFDDASRVVLIPHFSSPEEIGAAVRVAIQRCKN
jgi:hypothetical protein